jgi:hypothetical protein
MRLAFSSSLLGFSLLASSSPVAAEQPKIGKHEDSYRLGVFRFDGAFKTCNGRHEDVIRAFKDMYLLTKAVKDIRTDDISFMDYFGTGWNKTRALQRYVPNIAGNIQKAEALLTEDYARANPTRIVDVTCEIISPIYCMTEE